MAKSDRISGILIILFGLAFFIATLTNQSLSIQATTSDGVPGAGFFPYLLSITVMVSGLVLTVKSLLQSKHSSSIKISKEQKRNIVSLLFTVVALLVFLVAWKISNQFIICVPFLSFVLNTIYQRDLKFNLLYSTILTAFIYIVFTVAFSIRFVV